MAKEKPYIDPVTQHVVIDGVHYVQGRTKFKKIDGIEHDDKYTLVPVDPDAIDRDVKYIANKLKKAVKVEDVLYEIVKKMSITQRTRLINILKRNPPLSMQKGCLGVKVGPGKGKWGAYIRLFE